MSIAVKSIEKEDVKHLLKDSPKKVQQYVKALESALKVSQDNNQKMLGKIVKLSKKLNE